MKELQDIIVAASLERERGFVLASVVKTAGSTYRRAGARMLLTANNEIVGSVSGGCLEADVIERARRVVESGEPQVVIYDTASGEEPIWGLGLGCDGVVHVLIEHLPAQSVAPHITFLADCLEQRRRGAMATLFRIEGDVKAKVGGRLMMTGPDGLDRTTTGIDEPELLAHLIEDGRDCLQEGQSNVRAYALSRGGAEALIEFIRPPLSLIIFGAGNDALPVARFARELGWRVTVVDSRPFFATRARFPGAHEVIVSRPAEIPGGLKLEDYTAAVLMTHNYLQDCSLLDALLRSPPGYIGVLGSRRRIERLLAGLKGSDGRLFISAGRRLHAPTGLDIGAETPEEIALSIIAEIQAVQAGRSGGLLKNRRGPIHPYSHTVGESDSQVGETSSRVAGSVRGCAHGAIYQPGS